MSLWAPHDRSYITAYMEIRLYHTNWIVRWSVSIESGMPSYKRVLEGALQLPYVPLRSRLWEVQYVAELCDSLPSLLGCIWPRKRAPIHIMTVQVILCMWSSIISKRILTWEYWIVCNPESRHREMTSNVSHSCRVMILQNASLWWMLTSSKQISSHRVRGS